MLKLSIKSKLLLMLLSVSLVAVGVITALAFQSGKRALTGRIFDQLTSVRASKADQIETYLESVKSQVKMFGEDLMISQAAQHFSAAFEALDQQSISPDWDARVDEYYRSEFLPRLQENVEGRPVFETYRPTQAATRHLQYHYLAANPHPVGKKHELVDPADGSRYSAVHAEYHPIFRNLAKEFGYYDIFLIDPRSGTIVYSVYKETDFATSLRDGPYSNTNLAALVQTVRETPDRGFVRMIDFAPYRPSYAAPAAFVATPIYDGSRNVGVLAMQLPVDEINRIMTGGRSWQRDGLGASGETYLVGPDRLMRSVSRFLVDDPEGYAQTLRAAGVTESNVARILRYGTSILQQEVHTEAVAEAMRGKAGTRIIDDYRGVPVLSSFSPLRIPDMSWVVVSEIDLAEAFAPIDAFGRRMVVSAVVLVLLATLAAMLISSSFVKPIQALTEGARRVGAGETDVHIQSGSGDEFGRLADSFNEMVSNVRTQTELVEAKNRENEDLLLSVLPRPIAKRLKAGEESIADAHENVSVLFSDLVGFTDLSRRLSAKESVSLLNDLVSSFDDAAAERSIEKIKTIGDGYMAASGLSTALLDHQKRAVDFAREMMGIVRRFNNEHGLRLELRVGIHSGPLVAGIIGRQKFLYDLWGEAVNVAAQMKAAAEPGEVLVSAAVAESLASLYEFDRVDRGEASSDCYALRGVRSADAVAGRDRA